VQAAVSANKKLIETLHRTRKSNLGPLLADDVEWVEWADGVPVTGAVRRGKADYIGNFGDDELEGEITRIVEEGNVVVAEGRVRVHRKDGQILTVQYCDLYEVENGKVRRKSSYGALLKEPE
jgi:uncharacterized protein